jgi:hypothetical protein
MAQWHISFSLLLIVVISVVDVQGQTVQTRGTDHPRVAEKGQLLESGWWL